MTDRPVPAWLLEDVLVLHKAYNAFLELEIATGRSEDLWTFQRLAGMAERLSPPEWSAPLDQQPWWSLPVIGREDPIHDVATYRTLLREELRDLINRLERAGTGSPGLSTADTVAAIECIDLFLRRLRVCVNMVENQLHEGGVN